MSKKLLIIIGLTIILALMGIWGYILVYGTPEAVEDTFARFGSDDRDTDFAPIEPDDDSFSDDGDDADDTTDSLAQPALRQITTEPVAGYQFLTRPTGTDNATTTAYVYYAEAGTGHIYQYNIAASERERLSNHTIQQAHAAYITPDGSYAVVVQGYGTNRVLHTIDLSTETEDASVTTRSVRANNIQMANDGTLLYTVQRQGETVGIAYAIATDTERTLFTFPLVETTVAWSPAVEQTHYIYQRPATTIPSTVYRIQNGTIRRTSIQGYDLHLITNGTDIAFSLSSERDAQQNRVSLLQKSDEVIPLSTTIRRDKCAFAGGEDLVCGDQLGATFTSSEWKRGTVQSNDNLWRIFSSSGAARQLARPESAAGVQADIFDVSHLDSHSITGFRNRIDNGTLWVYTE